MADKDAAKPAKPATAKPAGPPQPVQIGGESVLDRLRPHIKQIAVGAVVVAVALIVIFVVRWFQDRTQIAATEQLALTFDVARRPVRAKDEKAVPNLPSFADPKERAAAVLASPGVSLAGSAYRGQLLLDAGKVDDAIAEFKKGTADKTIEGVLCREGLGYALEAKAAATQDAAARQKGYEDALAAFAAMQPDDAGLRRAYALYHQGRMQQLLGKRAEAKALFESAKQANKDTDHEIGEQLEKRLAALGA